MKLFKVKDLYNAFIKGKTFVSFQYIEDKGCINECNGDPNKIIDYLCNAIAGVIVRLELTSTPEECIDSIRNHILKIYNKHKDEVKK